MDHNDSNSSSNNSSHESGSGSDSGSESGYDRFCTLRSDLGSHLYSIRSAGSYATCGKAEGFCHPGIEVHPIGPLRLPLSDEDAHSLIGVSNQAPFGKGTETLLDTSVRKTWEINADSVEFHNQDWQAWLRSLLGRACEELGIAGGSQNVRAELHKMLLYETGSMFKPHRDEKVTGMFGTLVVCLPSKHEGGAVRLSHGGNVKRFVTSEDSAFNATYMAWYSDVVHEIEPLESGYRWVLVYNLVTRASHQQTSASALETRVTKCAEMLKNLSKTGHFSYVSWPFDHKYSQASICLKHLKGDDYARAFHVTQSCKLLDDEIVVLLAQLNRCERHYNYDDELEVCLDTDVSTYTVDLEGIALSSCSWPKIEDSSYMREPFDTKTDSFEQRGGGYAGNESDPIERHYRKSAMILVCRSQFASFLYGGKTLNDLGRSVKEMLLSKIENLTQKNKSMTTTSAASGTSMADRVDNTTDVTAGDAAGDAANDAAGDAVSDEVDNATSEAKSGAAEYDPDPSDRLSLRDCDVHQPGLKHFEYKKLHKRVVIGNVATTAVSLRSDELFSLALSQASNGFHEDAFFSLGKTLFTTTKSISEASMTEALTRVCKLNTVFKNITQMRNGFYSAIPESQTQVTMEAEKMNQWMLNLIQWSLEHSPQADPEDAEAIVQILENDGTKIVATSIDLHQTSRGLSDTGSQCLLHESVGTFVSRFSHETSFVSALFIQLLIKLRVGDSNGFLNALFDRCLDPSMSVLSLQYLAAQFPEKDSSTRRSVVEELFKRLSGDKETERNAAFLRVQEQASGLCKEDTDFLLALIKDFLFALNNYTLETQSFLQSLLTTYMIGRVGHEPQKPKDWAQPEEARTYCGYSDPCEPCQNELDEFLRNPDLKSTVIEFHEQCGYGIIREYRGLVINTEEGSLEGGIERYTLTKTRASWKKSHKIWENNCSFLSREIRELPQGKLKYFLAERYDEVISLQAIKADDDDNGDDDEDEDGDVDGNVDGYGYGYYGDNECGGSSDDW